MDEILIKLLDMRSIRLRECLQKKKTGEAGMTASQSVVKLKSLIDKLQEEINSYTTLSTNPQLAIVTSAMELQNQAEDYVLELESVIQVTSASSQNTPPENHTGNHHSIRLPKLETPKSNGEILKWLDFWVFFQFNIDNLPVASLAISNSNYITATILCKFPEQVPHMTSLSVGDGLDQIVRRETPVVGRPGSRQELPEINDNQPMEIDDPEESLTNENHAGMEIDLSWL